jgi:hypothetical protein
MTDASGRFNFDNVKGEGILLIKTKIGKQEVLWLEHIDETTREILLNQNNCLIN